MWLLALGSTAQLLVPSHRMIPRDFDVLTNESGTLVHLFTLPSMPVYMGVAPAKASANSDVLADMSWHISATTGAVQLHPLAPLEYVYMQQHNAVVGGTWKRHHDSLAAMVAARKPKHVLEIGGGHGYLAMKLMFSGAVEQWTMVDPNPLGIFQMPGLNIVRQYIEDVNSIDSSIDAVVHSHTLEHIYEPNRFFAKLRELLPIGSWHIFAYPNLEELMKMDAPCLHFEHTTLLSTAAIDWLLERHGFEVVEKQFFTGARGVAHSIFYAARLKSKGSDMLPITLQAAPSSFRESNRLARQWYLRMQEFVQFARPQLSTNTSLNFLYAAHVGTHYLVALGLAVERFAAILDNNPDKIGQRMYGTSLRVASPTSLQGLPSPRVVLRQGAYNSEISKQLLQINPSTLVILPQRERDAEGGNPHRLRGENRLQKGGA